MNIELNRTLYKYKLDIVYVTCFWCNVFACFCLLHGVFACCCLRGLVLTVCVVCSFFGLSSYNLGRKKIGGLDKPHTRKLSNLSTLGFGKDLSRSWKRP